MPSLKTALSITEFYEAPYDEIRAFNGQIHAGGILRTPTGSELLFADTYELTDTGIKVYRKVTVLANVDDLGFASKISFVMALSDNIRDYKFFAPANWYRQNEFTKP